MTMTVGDGMSERLGSAEDFMAWVAEHGPEWEDLLAYTESITTVAGVDGWVLYWSDPTTYPDA